MKRLLFLLLMSWAFSLPPANAAISTTNNGDGTTSLRLTYALPTASTVDVRDDICRGIGWTSTVTCTQELVTAGRCTTEQIGTQVANSETCLQAIDRHVRVYLRSLRKAGQIQEAEELFLKPVRDADPSGEIQ